jgi:hypothetical protein
MNQTNLHFLVIVVVVLSLILISRIFICEINNKLELYN